jgi:dTDP-4-amino-4,6-dideoxygalactose transaminase
VRLPVTEAVAREAIGLPIYADLAGEDVEQIAALVKGYLSGQT